jgi:hypothetical protein
MNLSQAAALGLLPLVSELATAPPPGRPCTCHPGTLSFRSQSKDPKGNVRASKPYRAVMEALGAEEAQGR